MMDREERMDEQEQERERARENELRADERPDERGGESGESGEKPKKESELDWRSNPPRTTTGRMTSPKFGSATSGGGEFEPGPEQD